MVSFFIPVKFPGLNDYIGQERIHRMAGANMKKKYTDLVCAFAINKKIPQFKTPVSISFEWYEANQKRDPDNIIFAKKFILDGLVNAKVIVKDSQKYILAVDDSWTIEPGKIGVMVSIVEYE